MKILIIGGTGVISNPLTEILISRGHDLTIFNRGKTSSHFNDKVKVITGDRYDYPDFEEKIKNAGDFTAVIDMICFTQSDAESSVRAFAGRICHYIFISTIDVYDRTMGVLPTDEKQPKRVGQNYSYGLNKIKCEEILRQAEAQGAFNLTIMHPGQTYREGVFVLPFTVFGSDLNSLDRLVKGKPIILPGDGYSLWQSTHAKDVACGIANAVANAKAFGNNYNLTGDEHLTWISYWNTIASVLGAPQPDFVFIPTTTLYKLDDKVFHFLFESSHRSIFIDNSKAKKDLEFEYTITWKEGCERYINWLKEHDVWYDSSEFRAYDQIIQAWRHAEKSFVSELKDVSLK